jgi:hypothetical protein
MVVDVRPALAEEGGVIESGRAGDTTRLSVLGAIEFRAGNRRTRTVAGLHATPGGRYRRGTTRLAACPPEGRPQVDGLTFVDHLIGHLMWPVIAVIALVAFYPVLRDRLGGLVRIKVGPGGVEGEFAGVLKASDRIMADAPVPSPSRNVVEDHERFERIAAISPRAAVLEAFTSSTTRSRSG